MDTQRLERQLEFIIEIDKLKKVLRQSPLTDGSRRENTAEHSWHIAVMTLVLAEHADCTGIDICRVVKMLLIHDLVEIDAGDTFCYDAAAVKDQPRREAAAADRIFTLLPDDQAAAFRGLWEDFQENRSPDARFANAMDRFQPLLHNAASGGGTWRRFDVKRGQVVARNRPISQGAPRLWQRALELIDRAVAEGVLAP